jgi:hypothetical protein
MAKKPNAKSANKKPTPRSRGTANIATATGRTPPDPPYKCQTTLEPGVCLRFNRNPATGQYNLPPGGIRVNCKDCEYFFD